MLGVYVHKMCSLWFFERVLRHEIHVDLLSGTIFFRQKKIDMNLSVDSTPSE